MCRLSRQHPVYRPARGSGTMGSQGDKGRKDRQCTGLGIHSADSDVRVKTYENVGRARGTCFVHFCE